MSLVVNGGRMSHYGTSGPKDATPGDCPPDGPLDAGRSVVTAVECNTARFVDLTHDAVGVEPTYLVLTAADRPGIPLSRTDVFAMPELQNAIAYFGPDTDSVRVQTRSDRRRPLREHLRALGDSPGSFEFSNCRFDLEVVVG